MVGLRIMKGNWIAKCCNVGRSISLAELEYTSCPYKWRGSSQVLPVRYSRLRWLGTLYTYQHIYWGHWKRKTNNQTYSYNSVFPMLKYRANLYFVFKDFSLINAYVLIKSKGQEALLNQYNNIYQFWYMTLPLCWILRLVSPLPMHLNDKIIYMH